MLTHRHPHLAHLEQSGLIRVAQVEPEIEYLFHHALVQDAAYDSLLRQDRRRLHLAVGEALEALYSDQPGEMAPLLAYHFALAGDKQRAVRYFSLAGELAVAAYANKEAEGHYRAALELVESDEERAGLLTRLGWAIRNQDSIESAIHLWQEAIDLRRALGQDEEVATLYSIVALAAWHMGDTPLGLQLSLEGLALLDDKPESPAMASLLHQTARAYFFNGLPEDAGELCVRALAVAERANRIWLQVDILTTMGILPHYGFHQAVAFFSRAAELAMRHMDSPAAPTRALYNLGELWLRAGEFDKAYDCFIQGRHGIEQVRGVFGEVWGSSLLGVLALLKGELDQVETMLPALFERTRTIEDPGPVIFALQVIEAMLLLYRGQWEEALLSLQLCQAETREQGDLQFLSAACYSLAETLLELGRWEEAASTIAETIALADEGLGWIWGRVAARRIAVVAHLALGQVPEARQRLTEMRAVATYPALPAEQADLAVSEARLALAEGRWLEARAAFQTAHDLHSQMGKRWYEARVLYELAEAHLQRAIADDKTVARELLNQAETLFEQVGAPCYAQKVAEMKSLV
ncbi:MAG: hypothetical protein H0T73_23905 [Ardenticatenales bacterium]|nr:hypothetical protein [Ardenticatenales bacterium]